MVSRQGQARFWWGVASCALMVLGAFGPWVTALGISISGTSGAHDGWFIVGAAIIALLALFRFPLLSLVMGLAALGLAIYDWNHLNDAIQSSHDALVEAMVQVGWGLTLSLIASISLAVASLTLFISPVGRIHPSGAPVSPHRECPHCKEQMRSDASVCPQCRMGSNPIVLKEGLWWTQREGKWLVWDATSEAWNPAAAATVAAVAAPEVRSSAAAPSGRSLRLDIARLRLKMRNVSPTKIIGAVIGAGLGIAIASLFISAALQNVSAPARLVVAVIMLGGFLGAALGAYIGSDDRRRRAEIAP